MALASGSTLLLGSPSYSLGNTTFSLPSAITIRGEHGTPELISTISTTATLFTILNATSVDIYHLKFTGDASKAAYAIAISGPSSNVTIRDNRFTSWGIAIYPTASSGNPNKNLVIERNDFISNGNDIYYSSVINSRILNNYFYGSNRAIQAIGGNQNTIKNNDIISTGSMVTGIIFIVGASSGTNAFYGDKIVGNTIIGATEESISLDGAVNNSDGQVGSGNAGIATGGSLTTLVDSTKTWTTNAFVGSYLFLIDGPGAGTVRYIASNTDTTLNVLPAFTKTAPTSATTYSIIKSPFRNIVIENNTILSGVRNGIVVYGASTGVGIYNNSIIDTGGISGATGTGGYWGAITVEGVHLSSTKMAPAFNTTIIGNTINNQSTEKHDVGIGVSVIQSYVPATWLNIGSKVENNTVRGLHKYGVDLYGATRTTVVGNTVSDCEFGIAERNAASRNSNLNIIKDNHVFENGTNYSINTASEHVTVDATLDVTTLSTTFDTTTGAIAATLQNGIVSGQRRTLSLKTDGGTDVTLTVTTHLTSSPEVFTFQDAGDTLVLEWNGSSWMTIYNNGVTM